MPDNPHQRDISILYVEDDPTTHKLLCPMLEDQGYRVFFAENGLNGLELYRKHSPDIILTDLKMPYMDGLEMAGIIREEAPEAQIIVLTAYSDTDYLLKAIDIGINQFIRKPVEFPKLKAVIKRCISTILCQRRLHEQEAESLKIKKLEANAILAGGMAHDFNNLLQVILGYISLARQNTAPDSQASEFLHQAEKNSLRASQLSQQLLTFARGGNVVLQATPLDQLITSSMESALNNTSITLVFDLPEDIPSVNIDATQMGHVFSHLAVNAFEAMPDGGTMRVAARACTISPADGLPLASGQYVHISVSDTGKGIAPEDLGRIFDPYFTTKETWSQKGLGLGLAICNSVIRKHNGIITVDSTLGNGTTFHVYLPTSNNPDASKV